MTNNVNSKKYIFLSGMYGGCTSLMKDIINLSDLVSAPYNIQQVVEGKEITYRKYFQMYPYVEGQSIIYII